MQKIWKYVGTLKLENTNSVARDHVCVKKSKIKLTEINQKNCKGI